MSFQKRNASPAQASVEYLAMTGTLLIIVTFLAGYSLMSYNDSLAIHDLQKSMSTLKNSINEVYSLGEGNSVIVDILLPRDINTITLQGKSILVATWSGNTILTDVIDTDANLSGAIPYLQGPHTIKVTNTNGVVTLDEI